MGKFMANDRVLRLALALCLLMVHASCAMPASAPRAAPSDSKEGPDVQVSQLPDGRLRLVFPPLPLEPALQRFSVEEARRALIEFREALAKQPPRILRTASFSGCSGSRGSTPWEQSLREQFIARYGTPMVPLPDCLEESALFMALRLSPRYMPAGVREAAQELFKDPVFLAGVATALVVYLISWIAPEPIFTKGFAMAVTVLLASVFTIAEIVHAGVVAWNLYQDTQGSRTLEEIEAAAERFGKAMGSVGFRILVTVASWGVAKVLPRAPPGGVWALLKQRRFAFQGGMDLLEAVSVQATSVQATADGTMVIAGVSVGNTAQVLRSACTDGSLKVPGFTWHHLATNKNVISDLRGGPWTPVFEAIFAQAGMTLDALENQVFLKGHEGPHPEEYHEEIHRRLREAIRDCKTKQLCRAKLVDELKRISDEVCTPGTRLHRLVTKS
ncbi:AHH domain-containing protein [Vitiosangium sp. GDMCC 1.1324]|uniref:AHH domain-containing protein n=1 Tax=Vitiosangium sp. (strain GDMCC 1.1324) TaxID=2138576 RepID=UPI000D3CB0B8|nr:AHH domain-containing protein [Vitiosangium sp. GDMCC 1.1324]PTL77779.1 hypothetical protein DAT35_41980 [Vitiosangium sp. GDMCC 1.1324]